MTTIKRTDVEERRILLLGKANGLLEAAAHTLDVILARVKDGRDDEVTEALHAEVAECKRRAEGYHKLADLLGIAR